MGVRMGMRVWGRVRGGMGLREVRMRVSVVDVWAIASNDNVVLPVPPQEVDAGNGRGDLPRRVHPPVSLPPELFIVQHVRLRPFHVRSVDVYCVQVKD